MLQNDITVLTEDLAGVIENFCLVLTPVSRFMFTVTLQLYLWRFVEDEALVHHLLDEVLGSALHRSLEQPPQLMEPSVVEVICDKGG